MQLVAMVAVEGESLQRPDDKVAVDQGLAMTEDYLWQSVCWNSFAMIARAIESPISKLEIPLCTLQLMTKVQIPMD